MLFTVIHFNRTTGRWHVEEEKGHVWRTDFRSANRMADAFIGFGFDARVVEADTFKTERTAIVGSLVVAADEEVPS